MYMPGFVGEKLFDDFMDDFTKPIDNFNRYGLALTSNMKTDIKEAEDGYEFHIDLPGMTKENVEVELKDGYLEVTAETSTNNDEQDDKGNYIRRERFYGKTSRSFYIGDEIKQEDISAKFENGVLTLSVKKPQPEIEEKPERKLIDIQ